MTVGAHIATANSGASTSVTSGTVTTTSGSTVVVFAAAISDDFAASNPLTDSKSNTWTEIQTEQNAGGSHTRAWYSKLTSAGASHTFTINLTTAAYTAFFVIEVLDGASTPNVLGDRRDDTDGTPFTTSPGVSPSGNCQLLGFARPDIVSGTDTHTWAGSFAAGDKLDEVTDGNNLVTGSVAATTKGAGTYNSQITTTLAPTDVAMWVVSVDTSAGGGGPPANQYPSGLPQRNRRHVGRH